MPSVCAVCGPVWLTEKPSQPVDETVAVSLDMSSVQGRHLCRLPIFLCLKCGMRYNNVAGESQFVSRQVQEIFSFARGCLG
jgi:hypothetical protein